MTTIRNEAVALSLCLALVGSASSVQAQADGPCKADRQKHCAGIEMGAARMQKCLRAHLGELSAACKKHLEKRRAAVERPSKSGEKRRVAGGLSEACRQEMKKLCVASGKPKGLAACLLKNESKLAAVCKPTDEGRKAGEPKPAATKN